MNVIASLVVAVAVLGAALPVQSTEAQEQTLTFLVESDGPTLGMTTVGPTRVSSREIFGWRRLTVTTNKPPEDVLAELRSTLGSDVRIDPRLHLFAPQDEPLMSSQWYLDNVGQLGGTPGADVGALSAWSITTGDPTILVAIIDSGLELTHPDLAGAIATNPGEIAGNGRDDDGNGYIDDVLGWDFITDDNDPSADPAPPNGSHGTWVAGALAARENGYGITGTAPGVGLLPIRSCTPDGCQSSIVAQGVRYAVDRGADIVNLSLGGYIPASETPGDPLALAIDYAEQRGVLVVAAAGNDGWNIDELTAALVQSRYFYWSSGTPVLSPAGLPNANILSIAATGDTDELVSFSNFGPGGVDVAAPGLDLLTTDTGASHDYLSGTSFAAPLAAGVAALMLSVNPDLTPAQIVDLISTYADRRPGLTGLVSSGARLDAGGPIEAGRIRDIQTSVFRDDVVWLASQNITKGCGPAAANTYCPERSVTRGQMAAFLVRALGLGPATEDHFVDDDDSIFEADINRLAEAGITSGCGPSAARTFCPDRTVTRGQMAAFLVRALDLTDPGSTDFTDDDDSIFEADIEKLAAAGVTKGCNPPANDRFCPNVPVSRGQMAAFLRRALG